MLMLHVDEASVRSMSAQMDDGESSGCDSEPSGDDDIQLSDAEEQNDENDDDNDNDVAGTAADSYQLEADVMKQLGLSL